MDTQSRWKFSRSQLWLVAVLAAGLVARFWVGRFGVNFDFDSYRIVVDLLQHGKNVYANTDRYNYGPIWFNLLGLMEWLSGHEIHRFRHLLVVFLSLADVGIFWVIWRRFGKWPATIFFLNPISIIVTGMHNQFDNLAILLGMWAVIRYGDDFERPLARRQFSALLLLGLSLMTKHVLFLFPFWLAFKQKGLAQKLLVVAVPTLVFLLGFAPYWDGGAAGIRQNVFQYSSTAAATHYFYSLCVPQFVQFLISAKTLWLLLLLVGGLLCRRRGALEAMFLYLAMMMTFAPATTNEYLVIPAPFAAICPNLFILGYYVFGSMQLMFSTCGLNLLKSPDGTSVNYLDLIILFLTLALVWHFGKPALRRALQWAREELQLQFKRD